MYAVVNTRFARAIATWSSRLPLLIALVISWDCGHAEQDEAKVIEVTLGSYQIEPQQLQLIAGQQVILRLVNIDTIIPHNFSIENPAGELDINIDVKAGETVDLNLTPTVAGRYKFFCRNKMLFMKSHREKGMEGILIVLPEQP
jgi:plastocyanin